MQNVVSTTAVFTPASKTIDFTNSSALAGISSTTLVSIVDITTRTILYMAALEAGYGGSWSGSVLTLDFDTTTTPPSGIAFNASDALQITTNQQVYVTNGAQWVRPITDSYNIVQDPCLTCSSAIWDKSGKDANDLLIDFGNVAGCSWFSIVKSAFVADTVTTLISQANWSPAILLAISASISNRVWGQEFTMGLVGVDGSYSPILETATGNIAVTAGNVTVAAGSLLTIPTQTAHNMQPGDLVVLYNFTDSRLNYGPVPVLQAPTNTSIIVSSALAAATYVAGSSAMIRRVSPAGWAQYIAAHRFVGATTGNNDVVLRNGEPRSYVSNWNVGNTNDVANASNENGVNYSNLAYAEALKAKSEYTLRFDPRRIIFSLRDAESNTTARSTKITQQYSPDLTKNYRVRLQASTYPNKAVPLYQVTAAVKSAASTTCVLTLANGVGHTLTTNHRVCYVGARDQTNFPNQTSSLAITAVDNVAGTITVAFGTAAISSSYGGWIYASAAGDTGIETVSSSSIQTYQRTVDATRGDRLLLVFAASPGGSFQVGEICTLYGLVDSTNTPVAGLSGRYIIRLWNTTTFNVELTPIDGQNISGVSTSAVNAGGGLIKNTEFRIHYMRCEHGDPQHVEVVAGPGDQGQADALSVNIPGGLGTVTVTATNLSTNMAQFNGAAHLLGTGTATNAAQAALPVTVNPTLPLPGLPQHVYGNITV